MLFGSTNPFAMLLGSLLKVSGVLFQNPYKLEIFKKEEGEEIPMSFKEKEGLPGDYFSQHCQQLLFCML